MASTETQTDTQTDTRTAYQRHHEEAIEEEEEEDQPYDLEDYHPPLDPLPTKFHARPAHVRLRNSNTKQPFFERPIFGPLLFPNESSDARDHCANERTFLSWIRLAVYLAVVSLAIIVSFHLKSQPSQLELKLALPLGAVFWVLSIACITSGIANYIHTVKRYSHRAAIVQSGWKTQTVFGVICTVIVASCGLFLAVDAQES